MTAVSVPQQDGEIALTTDSVTTVYPVNKGTVDIDPEAVNHFLATVPGSSVAAVVPAKVAAAPDV